MAKKTRKASSRVKRAARKNIPNGIVHIYATFNNTLITITDMAGNTLSASSGGQVGFKGSRKSTPFAAQLAAEQSGKRAMDHGLRSVEIYVRGPGSGREAAIRSLQVIGLQIKLIRDVTPMPHNGCRAPKRRRV